MISGGVVVMGDAGRRPGGIAVGADAFERLRVREVKLGSLARQQVVVEHLAQQRVPKAEPTGVEGHDDLRLERLAHRRVDGRAIGAGRLCEQLLARPIGDRERAQEPLARLREALDSQQQRLSEAGRERAAPVDAGSDQLLGEQRVAAAAAEQPLDHVGVWLRPEDVGELVGELSAVEALELDPPRSRGALELGEYRPQRMAAVQLVGPVGGDDDDPLVGQAGSEEAQERAGRTIGPVDVLDPEQHRTLLGEPVGELEEGVEEPALSLAAFGLGLGRRLADLGVEARQLRPGARRDLLEHRLAGAL